MASRRSYAEILIDHLKTQPSNQASLRRLSELSGWPIEKVQKVVAVANADPSVALSIGPGGTIQHRGTERGSSNGLYADVARVILNYWGPRQIGLRNISAVDTSRAGTRGKGVWLHPDLVLAADPRKRDSREEPRRLHAIEVETNLGFDLRSVYQAHAQGRGADYTWVFGSREPGVESPEWQRIVWTARELRVGLVTFNKPGAYGTWTHHIDAERRYPTSAERAEFLDVAVGGALRVDLEL